MRLTHKSQGYIAILIFLGVMLYLAIIIHTKSKHTAYEVTVIYDQIGTLQIDDLVRTKGVKIGKVKQIEHVNNQAKVTLTFDEPIFIREGTVFINRNYSLMGEREIEIQTSREGQILSPDTPFIGEFQPGISETMHEIRSILEALEKIKLVVEVLTYGNDSVPAFASQLMGHFDKVNQTLERMTRTFATLQPALYKHLTQVQNVSDSTMSYAKHLKENFDIIQKNSIHFLEQSQQRMAELSPLIQKTAEGLVKVEQSTRFALEDKKLLESTLAFTSSLQKFMGFLKAVGEEMVDENGKPKSFLKLKNLNIFGPTAREKARKKELLQKE